MKHFSPHSGKIILISLIVAVVSTNLFAEKKWSDIHGNTVEAHFSGIYNGSIYLWLDNISWLKLPFSRLDEKSQKQAIESFSERKPLVKWKDSKSRMAKATVNRMNVVEDGKLVKYDPGERLEPEFYAVYYSASWCGPCRSFSPTLKAIYNYLTKNGLENFELFYASSDRSTGEMNKYVTESEMPWKILWFSTKKMVREIRQVEANGIPSLVIFNREGHVLSHSYNGDDYIGPRVVLDELKTLVYSTNLQNTFARKDLFQIRLKEYLDVLKTQSAQVKPAYVFPEDLPSVGLEPEIYRLVGEIKYDGTFELASIQPEIGNERMELLKQKTNHWYFYPEIKDGRAQNRKLVVPIEVK